MKILIACERSGVVRRAFRARGHEAWSCDLEPADDGSPFHIQGDALEAIESEDWDQLIGHPPCTHLSLSGARWLTDHWVKRKGKPPRWHDGSAKRQAQREAVEFFRALWNAPVGQICLENPMSMASTLVAPKTQTIHPWQFGHGECKTTWLWLKGLPPLVPTSIVAGREQRIHRMPPGADRARARSQTYEGIAQAMAEQWGGTQIISLD